VRFRLGLQFNRISAFLSPPWHLLDTRLRPARPRADDDDDDDDDIKSDFFFYFCGEIAENKLLFLP